jgi:hypothetical protein
VASGQATSGQSDPGRLLRSFVVDLAIAAGALIAFLIGAITLTRLRRARAARSGDPAAPGRAGYNAVHARPARGQLSPPTSPVPARVVIWPSTPSLPASAAGTADASWLGTMTNDSAQVPGTLRRAGGSYRRQQPTGHPPWQPASPPRKPGEPPVMLPAETAETAENAAQPLAPWEKSPDDFATAPPVDDLVPWPITNTGPMYVWNPAATTGPLIAISEDEQEEE